MFRVAKYTLQKPVKFETAVRFLGTSPTLCKTVQNTEKPSGPPEENYSFVMNAFRGQIESKQVFPYPTVLNEEQRETLQMLVDPVSKFFEVIIVNMFYLEKNWNFDQGLFWQLNRMHALNSCLCLFRK